MRQLPGKDGPRETGRLVSDPRCLDYAASGQVAGALYSYQAWWQEPAYLHGRYKLLEPIHELIGFAGRIRFDSETQDGLGAGKP